MFTPHQYQIDQQETSNSTQTSPKLIVPSYLNYSTQTLSQDERQKMLQILEKLCEGYKDCIAKITVEEVVFKNGERIKWRAKENESSKNRSEFDILNNPNLIDQFLTLYVPGRNWQTDPHHDCNAGRFRHVNFFKNIYGSTADAVKQNLTEIKWLDNAFPGHKKLLVSKVLGVSEVFKKLSDELESLPEDIKETYLKDTSGTFNWRVIAGTDRLSAHSFGMTIDLTASACQYWLWDYQKLHPELDSKSIKEENIKPEDLPPWRNSVPFEIVEIFEKHGFMWGGKWGGKFDTMHFEYRPELVGNRALKLRLRELLEKDGYNPIPVLRGPTTLQKHFN